MNDGEVDRNISLGLLPKNAKGMQKEPLTGGLEVQNVFKLTVRLQSKGPFLLSYFFITSVEILGNARHLNESFVSSRDGL